MARLIKSIEVDTWTHFSAHLVHAANGDPLRPPFLSSLYASLVAQACNFGLEQMAHSTDLAYERLAWCTTWHLREETLKAAITAFSRPPKPWVLPSRQPSSSRRPR